MLARQRVRGPELGEDRDHHLRGAGRGSRRRRAPRSPPGGPRAPARGRRRPRRRTRARAAAASARPWPRPAEAQAREQPVGDEVAANGSSDGGLGVVAAPIRIRASFRAASAWRGSSSSALRSDSSSPARPARRPRRGRARRRTSSIWAGGIAPVNSATTLPSRKALTAGIPWTPNACESAWLESTSTLASSTSPSRSPTAASSAGPSWRQGPHHSAQKSTTTGTSRERSIDGLLELRLGDVVNHAPRG